MSIHKEFFEWSLKINLFGKNINQTTCCDVSNQYFVRGTRAGTVYVYDRNSLSQKILISSSEFDKSHPYPITMISISPNEQYLGVSTSNNSIFILEFLGTSNSRACKMINSHQEHKAKPTSIQWNIDSQKLLSGDEEGFSFEFWAKVGFLQQSTHKFVKEKTEIVQLHTSKDMCVMSALTRSIAINMEEKLLAAIGQAERNGKFGACFLFSPTRGIKQEPGQKQSLTEYIFCSRPQCKVWCCDRKSGKVLSTLKFPELTLKNYNFGKLLPFGPFLITWTEEYLTVLDVTKMAILEMNSELKPIIDIGVYKNICYVLHGEEISISRIIYLEEKNEVKEEIKEETKNPEILLPKEIIDKGTSIPNSPLQVPVSPIPGIKKETSKPVVKQETLIDSIFNIFGGDTKPTPQVIKQNPLPVITPIEKPIEKKPEKVSDPILEKKIEKPIEKKPEKMIEVIENPLEEEITKIESKPKKKPKKPKKVIELDTPKKSEVKEEILIALDEVKVDVIQPNLQIEKLPELKPTPSFKKIEEPKIEKEEMKNEEKIEEIKKEESKLEEKKESQLKIEEIKKEEPKIDEIKLEKEELKPIEKIDIKTSPKIQELKNPVEEKIIPSEKKNENIEIQKKPIQKQEEKSIVDQFLNWFGTDQKPVQKPQNPQPKVSNNQEIPKPIKEPPKEIPKMTSNIPPEISKPILKKISKETSKEIQQVEKKEEIEIKQDDTDLEEKIETKKIKKKTKSNIKEFDSKGEVIEEKKPKKKIGKKVKKTDANIEEAKPKFEIGLPTIREEESSLQSALIQEIKIEKKEPVLEEKLDKPSSLPKQSNLSGSLKETIEKSNEEKIELKPSSLPKQQIEIPQMMKPVVKQSVEDPTIYEEFKIVTDKIDSLYEQLILYEKTQDQMFLSDFIPPLQEWTRNLSNFSEKDRIPKKIENENKLKELINFLLKWTFIQEEKIKEDNICPLIKSLYQFLDINQIIILCNENQMFKTLTTIFKYEDDIGFLYSEREKILLMLNDNIEYASYTISQLGSIHYSILLRYLPILYQYNPELSILFSVYHYPIIQYWNFRNVTQNLIIYKKYLLKLFSNRIEVNNDNRFKIHLFEMLLNDNQKEIIEYLLKDNLITKELKEILKNSNQKNYLIQLLSKEEGLELIVEDQTLLPMFIDYHHSDLTIWTKLLNHKKIQVKDEIVYKMCEYLDSSQILQILNDPSITVELSPKIFDKLSILAESEQKQNQLKHEMLEIIDQYLWGKKTTLSPQLTGLLMNKKNFTELILTMGCHELSFKHTGMIRYPEESDINWGTIIDPAKKCKICQLPLSESIGPTLTVFHCGHSFHSSCVPHESCSICYQNNFTNF